MSPSQRGEGRDDDDRPSPPPRLVVIDGPAGAGKTSIARRLARHLGVPVLDTGAIYRALALVARRRGISWDDEAGLVELCRDFPIELEELDPDAPPEVLQTVRLSGEDVTAAIRTPQISQGASKVSAHPGVRQALLAIQRRLGASGCVAEGRDMGTVVFPEARHKFFLTADHRTRARRRLEDLSHGPGPAPALDTVMRQMQERDSRDSTRAAAPLVQAPDATRIDTSDLDIDQVLVKIMDALSAAGVAR